MFRQLYFSSSSSLLFARPSERYEYFIEPAATLQTRRLLTAILLTPFSTRSAAAMPFMRTRLRDAYALPSRFLQPPPD